MPIFFLFLMLVLAAILQSPNVKGFFGELGVKIVLKKLDKDNFQTLHNITLSDGTKTTQIDHIVIGRTGIFVIETKNYQGWIFGSEHNTKWTQTIYKSKKQFQNPLHQNYGHIKMLEHFFPGYQEPIVSIVNFSSNSTLKNIEIVSQNAHVLQTNALLKTILSYKNSVLSRQAASAFVDHLKKNNITDLKAKKQHVQTIKDTQQKIKEQVARNICPKCGQPLVSRSGKHGTFKGCSSYPKCRYTA